MKRDEPNLHSVVLTGPGEGSKRNEQSLPLSAGKVYNIERWLLERLLIATGNPPLTLVLWDGQEVSGPAPIAKIYIK